MSRTTQKSPNSQLDTHFRDASLPPVLLQYAQLVVLLCYVCLLFPREPKGAMGNCEGGQMKKGQALSKDSISKIFSKT